MCHYLIKADYSLWNILYIPALEQEVAVGFPYLYSTGVLILYETLWSKLGFVFGKPV